MIKKFETPVFTMVPMIEEPKKEKRELFKVPTVEQIGEHMKEKRPDWPMKFVSWYAEKFWNHYESQGWLLSNGNKMKSWRAAICNNWFDLKYECEVMLTKMIKAEPKKPTLFLDPSGQLSPEFMDQFLCEYSKHPTGFQTEKLAGVYEWMKQNKFILLTKQELKTIIDTYSDKPIDGKAACVSISLTKMANNCKTFSSANPHV